MEGSGSDASESPTITAAATQQGVILGTAAYLSPKQARGKPVDKRSDIWAFDMVLWEMLTGHRVFHGETVSETLAVVMMKEPEWDRLPADLPSNLSNLVRRCLEKDPRERVRDIGDVRLAMKGAFETVSAPSEPVVVPQLQVWQRPVTAVVVALVLVTVTGLAVWNFTRPNILPTDITRSIIALPNTAPFDLAALRVALAISRDGTQIVYTAVSASGRQLYVRPVDQLVARPLPGGEGGIRPFFSPSGEWVGFDTDTDRGLVKKVPVSGGSPVTVVRNPRGALWGASWGLDDQIITSSATDGGLFRVSANGGEPEPLTDLEGGDLGHVFPAVIPGTNAVLFVPGPEGPVTILGEISVLDLDTREVTRLGLAGTSPHYAPTGHIVYGAAGGTIRAAPFDAASLAVTGDSVELVDGVVATYGATHFSLSDTGTLVYVSGSSREVVSTSLVWVDETGREETQPLPEGGYGGGRLSPDGRRIATRDLSEEGWDLYVYDTLTGARVRLTQGFVLQSTVWTPDSNRIIFASNHASASNIYSVLSDGSGEPELLLDSEEWDYPMSVTPDGRKVAFSRGYGGQNSQHFEIWEMAVEGGQPPVPLLQGEYHRRNPEYSPDGNWLAFHSDESGPREVYVQAYPGPGPAIPVSVGGGGNPVWSRDGSRLFYISGDQLMTAPFDPGDPTPVGSPSEVFEPGFISEADRMQQYDTSPDGRLLIGRNTLPDVSGDQTTTQLILVENWFQELTERVPIP